MTARPAPPAPPISPAAPAANPTASTLTILTDQPIRTWFGVGGGAKRLARPSNTAELAAALAIDPEALVLGDGANLLVADGGADRLVLSLTEGEFAGVTYSAMDQRGYVTVRAGAGVGLFRLINETVSRGLAGLEVLAGIPASVGGAVAMNAGGKYGATGDHLSAVTIMDRAGNGATLKRSQVEFTYRHCSLTRPRPGQHAGAIITHAEFRLRQSDPGAVKAKFNEVNAYKKSTQPSMAERSAGCCFKNPTLIEGLRDVGTAGTRVSAGLLIDRAGCKGLSRGQAVVSDQHANFLIAKPGCTAADVLELMRAVRDAVRSRFGIVLEPEVVIWGATL
jgi:UDP-N-acetylmuramate dehydrogenase